MLSHYTVNFIHALTINGNKDDLGGRFNKSEIKSQNKGSINN